jgi:hypothetical protein
MAYLSIVLTAPILDQSIISLSSHWQFLEIHISICQGSRSECGFALHIFAIICLQELLYSPFFGFRRFRIAIL